LAAERIAIVGAGPAGMRAAATLASAGRRPIVLDEAPASGGQVYRRQPAALTRDYRSLYGFDAPKALRLHSEFDSLRERIDYRPDCQVWSLEGRRLHLLRDGRPGALDFDRLILATGAMDRVIPFPGWTLPGVYTLGGAQVALKAQACAVGRRTAFLGSSPLLPYVAYQYAKAGAEVAAVIDTTPVAAKRRALPGLAAGGRTALQGLWYLARLRARGIAYRQGATPLRALGAAAVEALEYRDAAGATQRVECDAIAFGYGLKCETQLADLAGCAFGFDPATRQWLPCLDAEGRTSVEGIYAAGDGAAVQGAEAAELTGERAARALLADLGEAGQDERIAAINRALARLARFRAALEAAFAYPHAFARELADETLVCRCEAVGAGEIRAAVAGLGADEINRAKAFSRVGMGRCQGRVCGGVAAEIVAATLGCEVAAVGRLRGQAPVKPVPIAALAEKRVEVAQ